MDTLISAPANFFMNGRRMWSAEALSLEPHSLDAMLDHFSHVFPLHISDPFFHCKSSCESSSLSLSHLSIPDAILPILVVKEG